MPRFPTTDYDSPTKSLALAGGLWSDYYGGSATVRDYLGVAAKVDRQILTDAEETIQCLARRTVPVLHRERSRRWIIYATDAARSDAVYLRYDDARVTAVHDDRQYAYDVPAFAQMAAFPAPPAVLVPLIASVPIRTGALLVAGLDYSLDRGQLLFLQNPFRDARFTPYAVLDDQGEIVDQAIDLWLLESREDRRFLDQHLGFLFDLEHASTEAYRDYLNSLLDAAATGSSFQTLRQALAALSGVPFAAAAETVEALLSEGDWIYCVTPQHSYRLPASADLLVEVGTVLMPGAPLCDSAQLNPLQMRSFPAEIPGIELSAALLDPTLGGVGLYALNQALPVTVAKREGVTELRFPLGGPAAAVEAFWDAVHLRGVAAGQTLAQLLDQRADPQGEPTAASLPATINPCEFLIHELLYANTILVRLTLNALAPDGMGPRHLGRLRDFLAPWWQLLVQLEVTAGTLSITGDASTVAGTVTVEPGTPLVDMEVDGAALVASAVTWVDPTSCGES